MSLVATSNGARVLRSVAGVAGCILLTSVIVESIEFGLVALIHGAPTTDPQTYLGIRNQAGFLAVKLIYNGVGGAVGGYVAGGIAGRRPLTHAGVAALLQSALLAMAVADPVMRLSTPIWAWIGVGATTVGGMLIGGWLKMARAAR